MMWEGWCKFHGVVPVPVTPALVTEFLEDCKTLPAEDVAKELLKISRAHLINGLADPTAGGVVGVALASYYKIQPPRSWPSKLKERFPSVPLDLQLYLAGRGLDLEKTLRTTQNEIATARQRIEELEAELAAAKPKADEVEPELEAAS